VHFDLEVGSAITVDVALHEEEPGLLQIMQLTCFIVEALGTDELEVLIASALLGVDCRKVNMIAITIDTANQVAFVFKGAQLIGVTNISTGKKGHPTPLGFWTINWKRPMYRSKKYDNAPMPFMQNIDDKGIAMHGGVTPGYPASHGCIRLPMAFAKQLYTLTKPGDKVVIEG